MKEGPGEKIRDYPFHTTAAANLTVLLKKERHHHAPFIK